MNFYLRNVARTPTFKKVNKIFTQTDYYKKGGACEDCMKLVKLNNKTFGETMQNIIKDMLRLEDSTHTGHDAILNGTKFEIKSSRYWLSDKDFKWQHIMEDHEYEHLILLGLDFNEIKIYLLSKTELLDLKDKGEIKVQGGGEGQGLWIERKKNLQYLTQIHNIIEFNNYLEKRRLYVSST